MKLHAYIVYLRFHHEPLFFYVCFFFSSLMPCCGKSRFLVKCHEKKRLNAKFQFSVIPHSKFHKTSWLYCLFNISPYALVFFFFFSSTGRRPASYCHGVVSIVRPSVRPFIHPSVRPCVRP